MTIAIDHKQGDTLTLECTYTEDDDATPRNVGGYAINAQARDVTGFLSSATVVVTDATNGRFTVQFSAADTQSWMTRNVYVDIQVDDGIATHSSETITVRVQEDVTIVA